MTNTENNKQVALRWLKAVGDGDQAAFRDCITADFVYQLMGTSLLAGERDTVEVLELARTLNSAMKNGSKFTILNVTAEESRVSVEFEGVGELLSGAVYTNSYHLLFIFRDGRISRVKEYTDSKLIDKMLGESIAE